MDGSSMKKVKLLNTFVNDISMSETLDLIEKLINSNKKSYLVAVNVDVIMKIECDNYLKKITDNADIVFVDGKPLIWISRLYKRAIKEKISGSDLVPILCELAGEKGYTIYILGGKEGIADLAKKKLKSKLPGIQIVGTYSPPFGFEKDEQELNKINNLISKSHPDILIVCFGCPKQEKFIYENYKSYDAKVSICAGATVDFLADNVKRAPSWMSEYGFEWLYRFLQEPKRMFKRYFVDDFRILGLIYKYRKDRYCR
jgi:N-acetylglucosaminyldiphosphoundecaprenol N-acetyl-beta-D-mannosaminyltransferase